MRTTSLDIMAIMATSIALLAFLLSAAHAGSHYGCYREPSRRRHFNINPGDHRPEITTVKTCMAACGMFDYLYSATTSGKFCYCSHTLPDDSAKEADSDCNIACGGDSSVMCGGTRHVSVYKSSKPITGLEITSDVTGTIIAVNTPVTLDVSIDQGMDVIYSMDYDDGAGRSGHNVTDMYSRTFYVPGEYSIHVYANDQNQTFQDVVAATAVRVDAPPGPLLVECDPVFATHEEGECTLTAWSGNELTMAVTVDTFSSTFDAEDPLLSLAGPGVKAKEANAGDDTSQRYLMVASEFGVSGKVLGWEMYVTVVGSGTLSLAIMTPKCSSAYCYSSNGCTAGACDSEYLRVTSCPADPFCMQYAVCGTTPTCASATSRYASLPTDYEVKSSVTVTVPTTGYQYIPETGEVLVEPGDVLALAHTSGNALLGRLPAQTIDDDDRTFASGVMSVGTTMTVATGGSSSIRHSIRAVASGGSKVHMPYTFINAGNHTMSVTASSRSLLSSPDSSTTAMVMVLEGVNATIIDAPEYAKTGEVVTFTILPHTGNFILYNWTFDAQNFYESPDNPKTHTFTSVGTFLVNVTTYNTVSEKNNFTWIQVEDELLGLALAADHTALGTPTDIAFSLTKGTNYSCDWNYDDSTSDITDDISTPQLGATQSHTYASVGEYTVTVDCHNNVSTISQTVTFKVQEAITVLAMTREGANKNTDFYLEWEVATGTEITFDFDFGGNTITTHTPTAARAWKSDLQAGRAPVNIAIELKASNLVSNETINVNFVVLSVIVNPTFTTPLPNATSHTPLTFTADMDSGSDVTIVVDWDDGSLTETHVQTAGQEWAASLDFTHTFTDGGIFDATASFTNKEGTYSETATITILVGVGIIDCVLVDYSLYHPPAIVDLRFEATQLPTDPTLHLNWGEKHSRTLEPALILNENYNHVYGDTGTYLVNATIVNLLESKVCEMELIVVEHLSVPTFDSEFPKAAKGMPYDVTFCLNRGPTGVLCNLTYEYGIGSPEVFERTGSGQDACDTHQVTYTSYGTNTIKVTALTPLETIFGTTTVDVIDGIAEASLTVADVADANYQSMSTFAVSYTGSPAPNSPRIKFIYGDNGVTEEDDAIFTYPYTQTHEYATDGQFNATVIVYNDATRVETNVTVGVYQDFPNLQASEVYFLKEKPPGEKAIGGYGGGGTYPQNDPIYFNMANDNNAYAETYTVKLTDSDGVETEFIYTTPLFSVNFPKISDYTVEITAANPLFSKIATTTVKLLELIKGMEVVEDQAKIGVNEPKIFNISFEAVGTDTCVYISFGDRKEIYSNLANLASCTKSGFTTVASSDKHAISNSFSVQNVFTTEGYNEVEVIAVNAQSEVTEVIGFTISGLDCSKPTVDIFNRKNYFTSPEHFKRSVKIQIRGQSTIQCANSYANKKDWRVEKMDPDYDTVISTIDLSSIDTSKAELNFPPRFLELGLYRVHYEMTMDLSVGGNSSFMSTTYTYINIDPSAIIGVMVKAGVSEITRGVDGGILVLDPRTYSYDPDMAPLPSAQGLEVKSWKCHLKDDTNQENCVTAGFNDARVNTQSLDMSKLTLGNTYKLTAEVVKTGDESRTSTTDVSVVVVAGDPPAITIVPREGSVYYQQSDGYRILATSWFAMACVCDGCTPLGYWWDIYMVDYRWPDGWRKLEESDTQDMIGRKSEEISFEANLFEAFEGTMKVQCHMNASSGTGSVATKLTVNRPPTSGSCSVTPLNRTYTPDKVWTIEVDGWEDEDGLDKYQFYIHTSDDEVDRQITSVDIINPKLTLPVSLSEGYDFNDYKEDVMISVYDKLGAVTSMKCATVEVHPIPLADVQKYLDSVTENKLSDLSKEFHEGDQKACTETATSIFSSFNSASMRVRTVYAGYKMASNSANSVYGQTDVGRPSYQQTSDLLLGDEEGHYNMESDRDKRARTREYIFSQLTTLPAASMTAVVQMTNVYNQGSSAPDEVVMTTQGIILESLQGLMDYMLDPANMVDVPPQVVESAMENTIAAIGNIMGASGTNGFFGTLKELESTRDDDSFSDYDASSDMETDLEMQAAPDIEAALLILERRIHKAKQESMAKKNRHNCLELDKKNARVFYERSVQDQELKINTKSRKMTLKKTNAGDLQGKQLGVENSVGGATLPNIKFLGGTDSKEPVIFAVSQSTNHPLRYSESAQALSPHTNYIQVDLYGSNNTKFQVKGLSEPVRIVIPRDANAKDPEYLPIDPKIPSWSNLMNYVVQVNRTGSTVFMDFSGIKDRQFLLVVKRNETSKIKANMSEDVCDSVHLMPSSMDMHKEPDDDLNKYRLIFSSAYLGNFTGKLFIGVRELNSTEFDMDISQGCDSLPRYENGSDYFNGEFLLRQYVAQCLAISDEEEDWTTDGCYIGFETKMDSTECFCNHLTTFAGGWVVVPNTIDWSYVFANADFLSNPTIYVTQIVIIVCFIMGVIYARLQDKQMAEKLGLAPLTDNDPKDKYFYEVIVCTGMRRNAGTNSQVCFILSGEDDETDIRAFSDSKRKIFKRGQMDGFLMTVPRCLGYLNFMRIWHDNSGKGKFGSWYLNYVIVRDVQTGDKQVFVANKWLAVEEDDGQVDRVIPVAGREQLADFSYQFGERTRKNLADGHLWFSVVARPPQSRFTCVQRVCCILCLLYVTMLANAMFYNTTPEEEASSNSFSIGPFSVSPEQIFIGVISNLIVFPVNFLLVFLFRKTRPHHKRPSRIDRAIQENNDQIKQASPNDVKPEVSSIFSVSKSPTIPHDPHRPDTAGSRPGTAMSTEDDGPKKKKKCELPWYFLIISWVLLVTVTLGAGMMVTFYGISFKDETCKKWISSMLVSFFMSVFITQPIKVFLFAIILSLIIKNPSEEKEDEEDDEEVHQSNSLDNDFLHTDDGFGATKPKKIGYKPPDPALLEKYRQKRLKEIKMWAIVREVIVYVFFLWILLVISYRQLGPANFLYKDTMHRVFIENNDTMINFNQLRNTDEFWHWAKSGLVNGIRAGSYYNDYPPLKLRSFVNDKVSRILGYATMRQLRVRPALCEIPDVMDEVISQCNVMYHILDQEEASFMPRWRPFASNETANNTRPEYTYTKANKLNGYPYWGTLAWYSGGGYVIPMHGSKTDLIAKMEELQRENWIDKYTRAIFVEFTVYNPQVNLFAINTILAEFHPSGGLVQSFRFEPAQLLPYMDSAMLFQFIIQGIFVAFTLFFIVRELKELIRTRFNYFKSFWNLTEIGIIGMSIAAIVIYFYRLFVTLDLTEQFKSTNGNGYVKFQYVGYWNEMLSYMIGFLVFLASLKFLKLLRFNKKITLLSATLHHSARSLLHFSIIYAIVFLAFAQLFYLTYMNIDIAYSTFVNSVVASVLMMMGKFNIYTMIMKEPVLTQVFVLLFVVTVTFIMVNMFISILNETFTVVREDINKQGNDYEIVDFMVNSFRKWTGIGGVPKEHDVDVNEWNTRKSKASGGGGASRDPNADPDCVDDFPDRIDRLLQSISAVYTDNDNFAKMYNKKPYQSGQQRDAKSMLRQGRSPSPGPGQFSRKDSSDALAKVHTH